MSVTSVKSAVQRKVTSVQSIKSNNLRKHLKSLPLPFRFAESSLQFLLSDDPLAPARFAPGRLVEKLTISFEGFHFSFLSKNHKRFLREKHNR